MPVSTANLPTHAASPAASRISPASTPEPTRTTASNIHDEVGNRTRAIAPGGHRGHRHLLAWKIGLLRTSTRASTSRSGTMPYHEKRSCPRTSAYNLLAGGSRLEHIQARSDDEVYLDALGDELLSPDPTTAGRLLPPLRRG